MSVTLSVQGFSVTAATKEEAARKASRHFGCIADNVVPDSGIAVAHEFSEESA